MMKSIWINVILRNIFFTNPVRSLGIFFALSGYTQLILAMDSAFIPTLNSLRVFTVIPEFILQSHMRPINELSLQQLISKIQTNTTPISCSLTVSDTNYKAGVYKGVVLEHAQSDTVFLVARGYAKRNTFVAQDYLELVNQGGGIIAAHMMLKDNIITHAPLITFDFPDERQHFNCGQDLDLQCLQTVWDAILTARPTAQIVGVGDCRGAKVLLALAAKRPKNLRGLVLLAPLVSTLDMSKQIAKNYLYFIPRADQILHQGMQSYFPSYDARKETLLSQIHTIDPQLPIFIAQRKNDYLISHTSVDNLITQLKNTGNLNIHTITVSDDTATHSRITPISELRNAVSDFLKQYKFKEIESPYIHSLPKKQPQQKLPVIIKWRVPLVLACIALVGVYYAYHNS